MNQERITLLLDSYASHWEEQAAPGSLRALWQAAERCAACFDLSAQDLPEMLRQAFEGAAPVINYAGSVQPLNGLLYLAEKEPDSLRSELTDLLAEDGGDLSVRQARMQAFCERCGMLLHRHIAVKRAWEQNLRSAIALLAFLRPADNYLYKATEARYLADMLGCQTDVSSGAHFVLAGYYGMCDALEAAIARHAVLSGCIPEEAALPPEALRRLMVADVLLNAGEKKLALFGDAEPLIRTRSRSGQATQERMMQINRIQLDVASERARLQAVEKALESLEAPELIGQRFTSPAFGEVSAVSVTGSVLVVEAGGVQRRLSQPACFLQGHLTPVEPTLAERFARERELLRQKRSIEGALVDLQFQISRLEQKP